MARRRFKKKPAGPIGKVNRSQTVSTFGIGSLYELRTYEKGAQVNSVIIGGLDNWPEEKLEPISEPVLEKSLHVSRFLLPPAGGDKDNPVSIPAYRFPEWLECSSCKRLGRVGDEFEEQVNHPPRCKAGDCPGIGIPVRLITACYSEDNDSGDHPGHIDDFPWQYWVHMNRETYANERCDNPELFIDTIEGKTGLDGVLIRCSCGRSRSLEGVFAKDALKKSICPGFSPWLGNKWDTQSSCDRPIRVLLRGASNVYFPVTASAISIPPFSDQMIREIRGSRAQMVMNNIRSSMKTVETGAEEMKNGIPGFQKYKIEKIVHGINTVLHMDHLTSQDLSEFDQRKNERDAMVFGSTSEDDRRNESENDFMSEAIDIPGNLEFSDLIGKLSKIHRLREVRAFRGFHRVEPPAGGDSYSSKCAPISRSGKDWLPAIEVRGEGIYLELNEAELSSWEDKESVQKRLGILEQHYISYCKKKNAEPDPELMRPRFVLIHTLSHLLIKQLSLECGYSSASIRERLYSRNDSKGRWSGVLLYTASACSDGTLGGLVRQGDPERLNSLIKAAIENARWCSSDPLCIESKGQGVDALNLAACHACCLVSETSCEQRNLFLDRALLIGTPDDPEIGFFLSMMD